MTDIKMPIAIAILEGSIDYKDTGRLKGLVLGSNPGAKQFLETATQHDDSYTSGLGLDMPVVTLDDGSRFLLANPSCTDRMRTLSQAYMRNSSFAVIFSDEHDWLSQLENNHKMTLYGLEFTTEDPVSVRLVEKTAAELKKQIAPTLRVEYVKMIFEKALAKVRKKAHTNPNDSAVKDAYVSEHNLFNIPLKPVAQYSNLLQDWNRLDPVSTPLKIDGVLIQDVLKQDLGVNELPHPMFTSPEMLFDFLKKHLLKNVEDKAAALEVLKETLHQGSWQRPLPAAIMIAMGAISNGEIIPVDATANRPDDISQIRSTHYVTTPDGFKIEDEVTQYRCVYSAASLDKAGEDILPDSGKEYVYKGNVSLDINFATDMRHENAWPRVTLQEQKMTYGNQQLQTMMEDTKPEKNFWLILKEFFRKLFHLNKKDEPNAKPSMRP